MEFYRKVVDTTEAAMRSKNLRIVSRVLMVSAFIEDGIRMVTAPGYIFTVGFTPCLKLRYVYCHIYSEISGVVQYNTSTPYFVSYILTLINGFLSLFGATCLIAGAKQREGTVTLISG